MIVQFRLVLDGTAFTGTLKSEQDMSDDEIGDMLLTEIGKNLSWWVVHEGVRIGPKETP